MQVISAAWFPSDMKKELRFIRPENLFFYTLIVIGVYFCKFQSEFHVSLLRRRLSLVTIPSSPDWWCRSDVCPSVSFSHLHIRSWSSTRVTLTKTLLLRLLSLDRKLDLGRLLIVSNFINYGLWRLNARVNLQHCRFFFCSLPQICLNTILSLSSAGPFL